MSRGGHGQVNYPKPLMDPRERRHRTRPLIPAPVPVRARIIDTATAKIIDENDTAAALASFDARQDEPFDMPSWLAKRVLKRQWKYRNEADRLTTCLALLYPKGFKPTRGEIAFHAEQACSITGLPMDEANLKVILRRAADAAEDLFRRGFRIPKETITTHRDAWRVVQQETTDDA